MNFRYFGYLALVGSAYLGSELMSHYDAILGRVHLIVQAWAR